MNGLLYAYLGVSVCIHAFVEVGSVSPKAILVSQKLQKMSRTCQLKECISKSTVNKNKWAFKVFREWKASRKVEVPVLDSEYCELHEVQPLSTDLESMDSCSLNYWLSKCVQEVSIAEGERYPGRTLQGIICVIRRHLVESVGSEVLVEALNPLQPEDKR